MSPFMQKFVARLRILPILIAVASLAFMLRIGDAVLTYKSLSGEAIAAEETKSEQPAPTAEAGASVPDRPSIPDAPNFPEDVQKAADATADAVGTQPENVGLKTPSEEESSSASDVTLPSIDKEEKKTDEGTAADPKQGNPKVWEDANDVDPGYSDIKEDVYKELADRRKQLDDREKKVAEREALLEAGQKELDRKYKELSGLRDEIQGLLKNQSEEENARLGSLVKIYTGMKPKDAARIFNTLDMDILVEVVGAMPEGKSSPILAAMEPDRARALTTLLAEQKKLPDIP